MKKALFYTFLGGFVVMLIIGQIASAQKFKQMKNFSVSTSEIVTNLEKAINANQVSSIDIDEELITVTGGYVFYVNANKIPDAYKNTAISQICFEPAEKETFNNGQLVCFANREKALNLLNLNNLQAYDDCDMYWGTAKIKLSNYQDNNSGLTRNYKCTLSGDCLPSQAELSGIISLDTNKYPKCSK